jgi:lysophospholipase L1-like esterase
VRELTFAGSDSVSVPAGQAVVSDEVSLIVPAAHRLAISLYFSGPTGPPTGHAWSGETTSFTASGDLVDDLAGTSFAVAPRSSYYVTGVEVLPASQASSVIVLGDSLSDGTWVVGRDSGQLWSNVLLARLRAAGRTDVGVINMAVGGNAANPHALARFDKDIALQSGARTVFVLLGWNDILGYSHCCGRTTQQIVTDLQTMNDRAHNAGLRVVGATLPPFGGPTASTACPYPPASPPGPVNPADDAMRLAVNAAIRPGGSLHFDAIADFDAVLRDPADPQRIQCQYAGSFFGWHAHPGPAGHRAMANAIDLTTLVP